LKGLMKELEKRFLFTMNFLSSESEALVCKLTGAALGAELSSTEDCGLTDNAKLNWGFALPSLAELATTGGTLVVTELSGLVNLKAPNFSVRSPVDGPPSA
jgi:hypothetical protein